MSDEIPVYEIDPKRKYILNLGNQLIPAEKIARIQAEIRNWLSDDSMPILLVTGDVKLVKVEGAEEINA